MIFGDGKRKKSTKFLVISSILFLVVLVFVFVRTTYLFQIRCRRFASRIVSNDCFAPNGLPICFDPFVPNSLSHSGIHASSSSLKTILCHRRFSLNDIMVVWLKMFDCQQRSALPFHKNMLVFVVFRCFLVLLSLFPVIHWRLCIMIWVLDPFILFTSCKSDVIWMMLAIFSRNLGLVYFLVT